MVWPPSPLPWMIRVWPGWRSPSKRVDGWVTTKLAGAVAAGPIRRVEAWRYGVFVISPPCQSNVIERPENEPRIERLPSAWWKIEPPPDRVRPMPVPTVQAPRFRWVTPGASRVSGWVMSTVPRFRMPPVISRGPHEPARTSSWPVAALVSWPAVRRSELL